MIIIGFFIASVGLLMFLFPNFFIKHNIYKLPSKITDTVGMSLFVKIWGITGTFIGIILIVVSLLK